MAHSCICRQLYSTCSAAPMRWRDMNQPPPPRRRLCLPSTAFVYWLLWASRSASDGEWSYIQWQSRLLTDGHLLYSSWWVYCFIFSSIIHIITLIYDMYVQNPHNKIFCRIEQVHKCPQITTWSRSNTNLWEISAKTIVIKSSRIKIILLGEARSHGNV